MAGPSLPSTRSSLLATVFAAAASLLAVPVAARDVGRSGLHPQRTATPLVTCCQRRYPVKVSFVVPCYRLAHLLRQCVDSILAQSYGGFEVIIMDDCSPDATPEVAASFGDARVRHVRNEQNLGHLANYNKGI